MTLPAKKSKPYVPLPANTHDETTNHNQRRLNDAAVAILAVLDKPWTCRCCGGTVPRSEWMDWRSLRNAADDHYQAERGTRYEGLSGATYWLALRYLCEQGILETDDKGGVRRR